MIRVAWVAMIVVGLCAGARGERRTEVGIKGGEFWINGRPTYEERVWRGMKIQGLLLNSRMVQGIFDDRNAETRGMWKYPDGSAFDAERNTREFIENMGAWRKAGLLSFTINLQGGSPQGYSREQPWINSAFEVDGSLREDYMGRLERILDKADELGMAPILGFFYFGQEPKMEGETAIVKGTDAATDWLIGKGYRNVLVEINNECNVKYKHEIMQPGRVHELIGRVKERSKGRLLVSTSYGGGRVPGENVAGVADYLLMHGNGVKQPERIGKMVEQCRALGSYRGQPIVFNEDDHFEFEKGENNFVAAVRAYASWGYFDFRMKGEGFEEGYQSVPVDWRLDGSERKRGFFGLVKEMAGEGR